VGELRVRPGMSPAYVHRIYSVFNVSIKAAMRAPYRILDASPCAGIQLPKRPKKAKPYLSTATADAYRDRERGRLRADYADALDFDLETGLRPGELGGLHADRLDLDRGWMLVAETFVKRRRVIRPHPKDKDVRMVPLTGRAIEILRRRLADRDLGAGCGLPRTDRGNPLHPDTLGRAMKHAAERAGVERRSPYAGRRGWATRAAEGGLDAFQIAEILGHSTLTQAQEYVQQTPAARLKLTAALSKYPQLVAIEGGLGQHQDHGADGGADVDKQPPQSAATRRGRGAS
jgi:integrase